MQARTRMTDQISCASVSDEGHDFLLSQEEERIINFNGPLQDQRCQIRQHGKGYRVSGARCSRPKHFISNRQVEAYHSVFVEAYSFALQDRCHGDAKGSKKERA